MTVASHTTLRVINGCLVVGVVAALLPQVMPHAESISGIMIVASAVVAFCAYLFGHVDASQKEKVPAVEAHSFEVEADFPAIDELVPAEAVPAEEVFLPEVTNTLAEPRVWVASNPWGFARRLSITNLNRFILESHQRAISDAEQRILDTERLLGETMMVWFDEKNSNVYLTQKRKSARKVPRSSQVIGSRLVH
jgi:hypothetical protein